MHTSLQASLEAIAVQRSSDFFKLLTELFQRAIDAKDDTVSINAALDELQALTYEVTGLVFEPRIAPPNFMKGPYRISVVVPNFTAFSVINVDAAKRMETLDFDTLKPYALLDGYVDLKRGRVGGFFSQLRNVWEISPAFFDGYFTADEVAGLYLHELSHAFTFCEYLCETTITNVILSEIVGRMDSQATVQKRIQVGKAALKIAGGETKVRDDINTAEVTALVLKGQLARMRNAIGTTWYDYRMAETVADLFASRWGAGVSLARALVKQERSTGIFADAGYEPIWYGALINFMNLATLPFAMAGKAVAVGTLAAIKEVSSSFGISLVLNSLVFFGMNKQHPSISERVAAIRRDNIALLKDRTISEPLRKELLQELELLDTVSKDRHEWSDVLSKLSRYALDALLGRGTELGQQEMTEELANNRLYHLSALLKG